MAVETQAHDTADADLPRARVTLTGGRPGTARLTVDAVDLTDRVLANSFTITHDSRHGLVVHLKLVADVTVDMDDAATSITRA